MNSRWVVSACVGVLCWGLSEARAQVVTLGSLLQEMVDPETVARFPDPPYHGMAASSYNRASFHREQPDQSFEGWFADSDGVPVAAETNAITGKVEWVLLETTGPGCLTRIWTPFFYRDLKERVGPEVRIYLDGAERPILEESLIKLVTAQGSVESPFASLTARAGVLYLPIPYARGCRVTMSAPSFYFNIAYRKYAKGTAVRTFTWEDYRALAELRRSVGAVLTQPATLPSGTTRAYRLPLAAGARSSVTLPPGNRAVRQLSLTLPEAVTNAAVLRSTVLALTFDGVQTVWCPVGDFFSSPDGVHPFQTLARSVGTNGAMICSWVMPYQASASVELLNTATQALEIALQVTTAPWRWDPRSMHFYARWRPDEVVPGSPPTDWNFVDIQGQGVYVGDSWSVLDIHPGTWWGEGDEKIYVDGAWKDGFPTQFGTGSEDYYGWAGGEVPTRKDEFSQAFAANVRVGGLDGFTLGYNVNTRHRALDAIPFFKRFVFDMESSFGVDMRHPWNLLGYSAVTYFYAKPGATHNRPPNPVAAGKPILNLHELQKTSDTLRGQTGAPPAK